MLTLPLYLHGPSLQLVLCIRAETNSSYYTFKFYNFGFLSNHRHLTFICNFILTCNCPLQLLVLLLK